MKKMIGYCGLDCEHCDAYIATKNNDQALREKTAKYWSEMNHVIILPEHINCEGCRVDGVKTCYCSNMCEIRKCAVAKEFETCGDCNKLDSCKKVAMIIDNVEEARRNLKK